jgi:hypothetical protein
MVVNSYTVTQAYMHIFRWYHYAGQFPQNKTKKNKKEPKSDKRGNYIMKLGVVRDALRCF